MNIGLLAYHSVNNFGASLQLLSTYSFLKNHGHNPIVINWIPYDLEYSYSSTVDKRQIDCCLEFRKTFWAETERCYSSQDVALIIEKYKIDAIIIGSDAVAQHHPFWERVQFPCKRIIQLRKITSDRMYPNPFWGEFNSFLNKPRKIAILSASSQDSSFRFIFGSIKDKMKKSILQYSYISTRDEWTSQMINYLTDGILKPEVTPDPVFGFNYNTESILPTKEEIQKKFFLPSKYILLSFKTDNIVSQSWISEFEMILNKNGFSCIMLPFSDSMTFGKTTKILDYPISPLEWYALIKYSSGYVGNNMHPIIVALHNAVPFFSFDNYGQRKFMSLLSSDKSSKILHILRLAGFEDNRISCIKRHFNIPTPNSVFEKILNFDFNRAKAFSDEYLQKYLRMMNNILISLN